MQPMLATLADAPLRDPNLVYEPKYDGIRALISVAPHIRGIEVTIASRLGNDKTAQFPEVAAAFEAWGRRRKAEVMFDGEIVALDPLGDPLGFENLQDRIHLTSARDVARLAAAKPVAFVAFDLLREGGDDLCGLVLTERRRRLEAALAGGPKIGESSSWSRRKIWSWVATPSHAARARGSGRCSSAYPPATADCAMPGTSEAASATRSWRGWNVCSKSARRVARC